MQVDIQVKEKRPRTISGLSSTLRRAAELVEEGHGSIPEKLIAPLSHACSVTIPSVYSVLFPLGVRRNRLLASVVNKFVDNRNGLFSERAFVDYIRRCVSSGVLTYRDAECMLALVQLTLLLRALVSSCSGDGNGSKGAFVSFILSTQVDAESFSARISPAEHILKMDPLGVYQSMTKSSAREYRTALARLAKSFRLQERELAWRALLRSRDEYTRACEEGVKPSPSSHIGYYIVGEGVSQIIPIKRSGTPGRRNGVRPMALYLLIAIVIATAVASLLIFGSHLSRPNNTFFICALIIGWDCAHQIIERTMGRIVGERPLPTIDYLSAGIPRGVTCIIAMPTILSTKDQVERALFHLEKSYVLSNDSNVKAVLLSDWPDALSPEGTVAELELLSFCGRRIIQLNDKYAKWSNQAFTLLHRNRDYSKDQQRWIGKERKRGKFEALHILVSQGVNCFSAYFGGYEFLQGSDFIFSVDDDCSLTKNSIQILVGAANHPLNRPRIDSVRHAVCGGYGMVVPLSATDPNSASAWRFPSLVSGFLFHAGSDLPRTRSFLFDLFGRSQYPGKALYRVETFRKVCDGRMPDATILSHDTIEGSWVRPAYAGEACVVESVPTKFDEIISRQHRWIRGNLQNLGYALLPRFKGHRHLDAVFFLVLSNQIRGDIAPVAMCAVIIYQMGLGYGGSFFGALALLLVDFLIISLPYIDRFAMRLARRPSGSLADEQRALWVILKSAFIYSFYQIAMAPIKAVMFIHAFSSVLVGFLFGRGLLNWKASSHVQAKGYATLPRRIRYATTAILVVSTAYVMLTNRLSQFSCVVLGIWSLTPSLPFLLERRRRSARGMY